MLHYAVRVYYITLPLHSVIVYCLIFQIMVNNKKCYLCDKKVAKENKVSLHKFPNLPHIRKKWIDACDLYDTDNLKNVYICSCHFHPGDVTRTDRRTSINPLAVPSINVPNPDVALRNGTTSENLENNDINNLSKTKLDCVPSAPQSTTDKMPNEKELPETAKVNNLLIVSEIKVEDDDSLSVQPMSQNVCHEQQSCTATEHRLEEPFQERGTSHSEIEVALTSQDSEPDEQQLVPLVKRRFGHPRFVSEVQVDDVDTPKKARITINFVKQKYEERAKEIKRLRGQNRNLKKRVKSMENMIAHLCKEKNQQKLNEKKALLSKKERGAGNSKTRIIQEDNKKKALVNGS